MKLFTIKLLILSNILLIVLPESASALPGFARQTSKACSACHMQNIPKLNAYGRHFALSGYTLYDTENETQSLIEGSDLSLGLPAVLNASAVLKARYLKSTQESNATDVISKERGELQALEGSGLFFGGRMSENIGGLVSLTGDPSQESDVVFGAKAVLAYSLFNGFSGLSLYSTQTNGIFSGMENFNTGLNSPLKQFENANSTNAAQATGIGRGPATGMQVYYGDNNLFATLGAVIPSQNSEGLDAGSSLIPFGRLTYNHPLGDTWNIMLGIYGFSGDMKASDQALDGGLIDAKAKLVKLHKEGYGFDLEASGNIGDITTMTTLHVVMKNSLDTSGTLISPNLQETDNQAASIEFQINPFRPLGLKVAYLTYNDNDSASGQEFIKSYDFDAASAGLNYSMRQNVIIDAQYSYINPALVTIENYSEIYLSAAFAF